MSTKTARRLRQGLVYLIFALALLWTLLPFWIAFALSIKHSEDFFTAKLLPFIQFQPTLANWRAEWRAFGDPAGLGWGLVNSLLIASLSSGAGLVLGGLAAFGLLLRRGRLTWPLFMLFLLPRLIPPIITALPFSMLMTWLGLADTRLALFFAHTSLALPLALLILYSVMTELPLDILDAARIDGCGPLNTLRLIVVPLLGPALLAAGILCFAQSWNEFLYALMNAQQVTWTAPLSIASLVTKDGIEFEYVGSHLLLVTLPPPLLALLAQRYIVRGLSLGTIKD